MCHMKTIQDTTFDRKEDRVSQRGGGVERKRDAGPWPMHSPAAAPDLPAADVTRHWLDAAKVKFCVAGLAWPRYPALGAQPSGMDILLRDLSSELTTGPDFHNARKS